MRSCSWSCGLLFSPYSIFHIRLVFLNGVYPQSLVQHTLVFVFFVFCSDLQTHTVLSRVVHNFHCSSPFHCAPRRLLRFVAYRNQRPSSVFSCLTKSITSEITMSAVKRKATSAAAAEEPSAKQQKLAPMKEKKERAGGWLQDLVTKQRTEMKELKFNNKRLRFISETKKIKQGSEGVLYWMSRDQRVQGKHLEQLTAVH